MIVFGSGGFAKQLLEAIIQNDPAAKPVFYNDTGNEVAFNLFGKYPILKTSEEANHYLRNIDNRFTIGISGPATRRKLANKMTKMGGVFSSVISSRALIGNHDNELGKGINILSGVTIENGVTIKEGTMINLNTTITHDVTIGKYCELGVGVTLSGAVTVEDECFVGSGAIILPKVHISKGAKIGAGAVVTKDVEPGSTVVGIPAKTR